MSDNLSNMKELWKHTQSELKKFLILQNDEDWHEQLNNRNVNLEDLKVPDELKFIGGIDISFDKDNNARACVCFVVLDAKNKKILKKHCKFVNIVEPYIVNFLAFRECEHMIMVVKEFIDRYPHLKPQVILVDGNGLYHQYGFGSACQLGVRLEQEGYIIPTIGVAKNYQQLPGMPTREEIKQMVVDKIVDISEVLIDLYEHNNKDNNIICTVRRHCKLKKSKSNNNDCDIGKLVFISVGHRISLNSAVNIVRLYSNCRVPEPILQADHHAKNFLHNLLNTINCEGHYTL